jgi:nucleoside-diphosphate-sugar epimerase
MPQTALQPARPSGSPEPERLTVAVTGASGTVGPALLQRLVASEEVEQVRVLGRRRTGDMPDAVDFRRLDVRDDDAVSHALAGADAVVHMAYALYGVSPGERELFATNVRGTRHVARAAARAGARRFVYLSSAAVYGVHANTPQPLDESAPIRACSRHFYARHKAQTEVVVRRALAGSPTEAYVFRPCGIVGPHAAGATMSRLPDWAPGALAGAGRLLAGLGLRPWVPAPPVALQAVHEDDVAQALALAVGGAGMPGVYNLAGDGVLDGAQAWRLVGLRPLPLPRAFVKAALKTMVALPAPVPAAHWPALITEPILLDTRKARRELGWRPRFDSAGALEATRAALGW